MMLLALTLTVACGGEQKVATSSAAVTPVEEVPRESTVIESPSMQFLPRENDTPNWKLQGDPLVLVAEGLQEYMAKRADYYRQYELIDLTVGEYNHSSGGFATVEIFRFPDFVKAFGAYSNRRKAVVNYLDLGNESFVGPHSIHIWSGPFYVRIIGGAPMEQVKELAGAVAAGMPEASGKPAVFDFFPPNGRVVNSEVFSASANFGQPYLAGAFRATFEIGNDRIDGLILPADSKEQVQQIFQTYKQFYASSGKLLDPVTNLGEDNFTGEDRYLGRTAAFRLDRFLVIFRGYRDKQTLVDLAAATDKRILTTIRRQLQAADKARPE